MSKVIENEDGTLSFPELDYSNESLNEVWTWIRDDLAKKGRVYNHKIKDKHEECPADYTKATLEDVLSKLRTELEEEGIIDIDYEEDGGEDTGGPTRKIWVLDQ